MIEQIEDILQRQRVIFHQALSASTLWQRNTANKEYTKLEAELRELLDSLGKE